jgi:hypothetical protein
MKISSDAIGNRNRGLTACSAVPQLTAPPRVPVMSKYFNLTITARSEFLAVVIGKRATSSQ